MKKKLAIVGAIIIVMLFFLIWMRFFSSQKKEIQVQQNRPVEDIQENTEGNISDASDSTEAELAEPEKITNENNNSIAESTVKKDSSPVQETSELKSTSFKITDRLVSWGFQKTNGRSIDTIIIHSSYNAVGSDPYNLDDIINKEYKPNGVSPHYIISRDGKAYRLVEDKNIAYHAGESKVPDGRTNVNNFSIGIEVVNKQSEGPAQAQYDSLKNLLSFLKSKYKIKYILGHSDIAPGRKNDPWNFNWDKIK